jgi:threonine dehydrogenase-like Zn-dependent dehydrogenase
MGWGGGLSDYVCVDARFVFKLPETIPSDIGGKELRKHRSYEETC